MNKMNNVGVIVLAAGKGTRMKSSSVNKVAIEVGGKPLIVRTIDILKNAGMKEIVVVVGFAKESVIRLLSSDIKIAIQEQQLGTGDAARVGLRALPTGIASVFSVYGDDSFLYTPEIFHNMEKTKRDLRCGMVFATVVLDNPTGYGRIIRNDKGEIIRIVEEANATEEERLIKEVNTGCYLFDRALLEKYIGKIEVDEVKSEYYLTDIVEVFIEEKFVIGSVTIKAENWRGVNAPEEIKLAEKAIQSYE